jgi:ribosomal protein L37E
MKKTKCKNCGYKTKTLKDMRCHQCGKPKDKQKRKTTIPKINLKN